MLAYLGNSVCEESVAVPDYFLKCEVRFMIAGAQSYTYEKNICCSIHSRKRESRDRDNKIEKQWTGMEIETKTVDNDVTKKNGEERPLSTSTTSSVDESLPKVNPVKWTVMRTFSIYIYIYTCYTHVAGRK